MGELATSHWLADADPAHVEACAWPVIRPVTLLVMARDRIAAMSPLA